MHVRILVDWKYEGKLIIEEELTRNKIGYTIYDIPNYSMKDRTHKFRIIILYLKYLAQANKVVSLSSVNDLILCLNFTTAIAVGFVSKIRRKKCRILGLNIIAPPRRGIIEKIRFALFHNIMKMKGFYITLNSKEYISDYSNRFKINENRFFVLHDAIIDMDDYKELNISESYVFSGGEAMRDWVTMFKACELCPAIKFVFVARKKYFNPKLTLPNNAVMLFDIAEKEFYDYLKKATIVALPLQTNLPAGLIVVLKSAVYHKPVISTRNPSIENYVEHNKSGFIIEINDYEDLSAKIKKLFYDPDLQEHFSNALYNKVTLFHSPKNRAINLLNIINAIVQK